MNEQYGLAPHTYPPPACAETLRRESAISSGVLRGTAAARGTHVGIARVLSSDGDMPEFRTGDVLVCRTMSPASLALLARAGALVTDTGGVLSNAAIVARERGIPAVVATGTGTRLIRDGQRIAVDGERGVVRIVV